MKQNYTVYVHINKTNGKMYIGITKKKPSLRWGRGAPYKHNPFFYNAIQKYSWDNFDHDIIASGLTKKEAENFEMLLIAKLDTTNQDKGYNIEHGGNTCGTHSEYTKNKMRGKNNPAARKVICLTTNKIFNTAVDGAKYYGITRVSVKDCCSKRQHTTGSNIGIRLKWMYYDEYLTLGNISTDPSDNTKKVICLETDKIYDSIISAAIDFNISSSVISNCCNLDCLSIVKNKEKYHFMFYEDFLKYGKINFEKSKKNGKVIYLPIKKIYDSILQAERDIGVSCFMISRKCRRMYYLNEKSDWMYYEDYLKLQET